MASIISLLAERAAKALRDAEAQAKAQALARARADAARRMAQAAPKPPPPRPAPVVPPAATDGTGRHPAPPPSVLLAPLTGGRTALLAAIITSEALQPPLSLRRQER